jgi:hypothetical protein
VGVALLCFAGFGGPQRQVLQLSHAFFVVYNLTAGRVKLKLLKMKKSMFTAFALGLCLTANLMAQVPNYVPTNGLVGYWPFNGNANDESGNGNNGTVNGATLTTDRFGVANKAYNFDGVNDFIDLQNLTSNLNFSVSLWFNASEIKEYLVSGGNLIGGKIISKFTNDLTYPNGWESEINPQSNLIATGNGVTGGFANTDSININTWYNIVFVYNSASNNVLYFINGQSAGGISNFLINSNGINIRLGARANLTPNFFYAGKIDDIGIWNRALNDCEIQDLYNSQINSVAGSISVSPQPATIGLSVLLSTASQTQNVQWQSNPSNFGWQNVPNNANYSSGTTNTLTVSNVQLSNHNQPFRVIASAGNCTDTSNVASILIADTCITNVTVYDTLYTTVTDTLIINTTLSLPAPNNENTILIYPNPASDHITIDNGNFAAMAGYTIKIENNAGQQVFQSAINQAQFYVDLSTWTGNGLYFVQLIDPQNNTVTVRKIVLQ